MYWKIFGWSHKGSISCICLAPNKASAKSQFEMAAKNADYGPIFWDQTVEVCSDFPDGKVSLLRCSPSSDKTFPKPRDWSQHDFELSISKYKLNTITDL